MTRPPRLVVVGSGIAGLYAALIASDAVLDGGPACEVVLLSKGTLEQSNTFYAQGGVSAVLTPDQAAPGDSVEAHIADTLAAGAGLNDPEAVRVLCTEAVRDIAGLGRYGVHFDAGPGGGPALGLEAAHSAARILHAGGDATGACIARALVAAVLDRAVLDRTAHGRLRVETGAFVTDLLTGHPGQEPAGAVRVTGVAYLANGQPRRLDADAVLLATGGAGRLFARTSNPSVATADGLALAWRAGAAVRDLEFFQFHPTTLAAVETPGGPPALLISEAVRGRRRRPARRRRLPFYARLPPGRRACPARRRLPQHCPAPRRDRCAGGQPRLPGRQGNRGRPRAGIPGPALPHHHRRHPRRRLRLDHADASGVPGGALLDGRCVHRPPGAHLRAGTVRGR